MLELINVKKVYTTKAGDTAALNGVNITFPKTGMVFITGKSGSGKTTMLNVVGGLDGIDEGDIIIEGKKFSEFTRADYDSYRNTFVGFIFQEYNLLGEYSVEKNIAMANELQGRKTDYAELENLLETVDLAGYGSRKISELSGGQKQRVAIARALVKNPQIIMADEPTGALDSATGVQVMETLKKLASEKLIIVVSHDLELAEKYADRIVRLVDGQIIEDVSLNEVKFEGSFYESESEIIVKAGGDLTKGETDSLINAIKDKKKISVTDKIYIRKKEQTKPIKVKAPKTPVKLINSKMKLKSAIDLGLKSLFVKPFRLIVTIILSVVAFSVFGLFDTVAAFTGERIVANSLRTADYQSIVVDSTIKDENYSGERLKLSQEYIDNLNKKTGYNFRGIYDINDSENVNVMTDRIYINKQFPISQLDSRGIDSPKGNGLNYYNLNISGYIEFKNSEVDATTGVIDANGFNYKIVDYENSAYPVVDSKEFNNGVVQVAISSYMAETICHWYNRMGRYDDKIEPKDLIGKSIFLASLSNRAHLITAIVDCGQIPEKYDRLKDIISSADTAMLEQDIKTFLNSGAYLTMFVGEGFIDAMEQKNNRVTTYATNYLNTEYTVSVSGTVGNKTPNVTSFRYYNENEFTKDDVLLFDLKKDDAPVDPQLKANETLIHINNLEFLFKNEFSVTYENPKYTEALQTARNAISTMRNAKGYVERRSAFNDLNDALDVLFEYLDFMTPGRFDEDGDGKRDLKTITIKERNTLTDTIEDTKVLTVKGVYFGKNTDLGVGTTNRATLGALVLSESGLKSFGIILDQGKYSRLIAPSSQNYTATSKLAKYMTADTGIKLNWHKNTILNSVEDAKIVVKQFSDLFLYASLALAVFAVFMLFNYISTSIISKRQSIGVLRALGADGKNIFEMFITESLIISIVNGILACVVTFFACQLVNKYVIDVMDIAISFAIFGIRQVIVIFATSLATGILSSLLPIIKIAKEKPVDLIRKV